MDKDKEKIQMRSYEGRKEVYDCVQEMIDRAGSIIRIMTTENGIVRMYKRRERIYRETISERHVTVKIALPITKDNLWHVEQFVKMGAEIKHLSESARNRFVNIDGKEVMAHFTSQDDKELEAKDDYGVWTNTSEITELTVKFFDTLWDRLETFHERQRSLKFGSWNRVITLLIFLSFVFATILLVLRLQVPPSLQALLISVIATSYWVIGERIIKIFFRKRK